MEHPGFYERAGPFRLSEILEATSDCLDGIADYDPEIRDVRTLDNAGDADISFLDNVKYVQAFVTSAAAACFVAEKHAKLAPEGMMPIVSADPYRSFARALLLFYPDAMYPKTVGDADWSSGQNVHATARIEEDVRVEPGVIVGPEAHIGRGTILAAGAVIGYRVHVGRDCYIGPNASITNSLIGDRVIIHSGAGIGQDGYGFAMGSAGHLKVPQIGRVIVQDDVEIGANTTIDRGALRDTVVGEGTKIDNLVQIGHNVVIGRHSLLVAQTGIAGSTELGDFVIMAGQSAALGHLKIGVGAQVGAKSAATRDIPAGTRWGGTPARPIRQWARELAVLKKLAAQPAAARRKRDATDSSGD